MGGWATSGSVYFSNSESHALNRYGHYHDTGQGPCAGESWECRSRASWLPNERSQSSYSCDGAFPGESRRCWLRAAKRIVTKLTPRRGNADRIRPLNKVLQDISSIYYLLLATLRCENESQEVRKSAVKGLVASRQKRLLNLEDERRRSYLHGEIHRGCVVSLSCRLS